jgi:hypothetical protein
MWYRGTIDMDNVHYCNTEEEAEREIDDAIIAEQEAIIQKLTVGMMQLIGAAVIARDTLKDVGIESERFNDTIRKNEQLLKQIEA